MRCRSKKLKEPVPELVRAGLAARRTPGPLDANIWIAAFDPADRFRADSVAVFKAAGELALPLAGPSFVILEAVSPRDWLAAKLHS